MWTFSSLLAIAAVIFSPLVHIVFYFIPKDGFDQYEKSMFKKYFLSIAALGILGIVVSIVIPSIIGQDQASEIVSEVDTSQPRDWDIRAENQDEVLAMAVAEPKYDQAEKLHYEAIYQAHPDADKIMESPEFEDWLQGKPAGEQDDVSRVLNEGTAAEVIYVFSNFKQDLESYRAYEYQAKRDNAQALAQTQYQERRGRELETIRADNQRSADQQRKQEIEEYVAANRAPPLPAITEAPITSKPSYSIPAPIVAPTPTQIVNCDGAGCWGTDGTRYNKGAGNTYFPSTGGVCQNVGGQMNCS